MGKICVVKSCPSGRKKKKNKNITTQFLSFFQAKTPEKLDKWRKSLGIKLRATDYICHLHFKEEHIKMYEKLYIGGKLKLVPTLRNILKKEASPTIDHQYVPLTNHQSSIMEVKLEQKFKSSNSTEVEQQLVRNNKEKYDLDVKVYNHFKKINDQTSKYLKEPSCQQRQDNSMNQQKLQTVSQSIDNFKNSIKENSILPPLWLYVEKPNGLEFMRINPITRQISNYIRLNEDLSISVIFSNNDVLHLNDKIMSIHNIYDYLKYVEKWPLCVGTQIDCNKFSKRCKGVIIGDDAYKRYQRHPRCKFCRVLRNGLLYRNSTSNKTVRTQRTNNLKQQCKWRKDKDMVSVYISK